MNGFETAEQRGRAATGILSVYIVGYSISILQL